MTDHFDPYYTWLGIPPEEQPATHYRLLGVRQFEPNLDVISNAGDQRMAFLRTFQVGKRSALSQRLLNEMAAAKVCLLDPDRRKAYDEKLKAAQPKPVAPAPLVAPDPSPPSPAPTPSRPAPVPRALPVAARLPRVTPDPFALADPFADAARDVQVQRKVLANPQAPQGGNPAEQLPTLTRAALLHLQQLSPLAAAAYGVLVLGVVMLLSVGLWIALGGSRQQEAIAAVPAILGAGSTSNTSATSDSKASATRPDSNLHENAEKIPAGSAAPSPAPEIAATMPPSTANPAPTVPSKSEPTETIPAEKPVTTSSSPSPPEPANPPSNPSPAVPLENPFLGLAKEVSLPALEDKGKSVTTATQPIVLGSVKLPASALCLINIRGGDDAISTNARQRFELASANGGTAQREWEVHVATQGNSARLMVARLGLQNDELTFQWTDEATRQLSSAPYFCNCILSLTSGKYTHQLALRQPLRMEPMLVDFEKPMSARCRLEYPPSTARIVVQLEPPEGRFPKYKFDKPELAARNDNTVLMVGDSWEVMVLQFKLVAGLTGKSLKLDSQPQYKIHGMAKPEKYNKAALPRLMAAIDAARQRANQQLSQLAANFGSLPADQGLKVEALLRQNIADAETQKIQAARLADLVMALQAKGKIHFQVCYAVDRDTRIALASTASIGGSAAPETSALASNSNSPPANGSSSPAPAATVPEPQASGMTPAQAAERLRAIGVTIYVPDPENVDYVGFQNCKFTDDDIRCLATFPRLKTVSFQNVAVTGQTLKCLQNCRGLQSIHLPKSDLGDEDLAHLAPLTALTNLGAMETKATAACLEPLAGLTNLESLMLPQSLGRELIPHLANYPKLRHFHPIPHYLTDEDMKVIGSLRRLEFLDLQTSKLTLEGYKHLANLTEARSVQLPNQIPPGAIGCLSKMKLEYVTFPESTTIDEMRLFQGMTTLRFVRVSKSVTDEGLQLIAGFKSVENFALTDASLVTPAGMAHLATMKSLKSVTIPHHMGDEGLAKLAGCQSLVELSMDDTSRITNSGLKMLGSLPKLERLRLPRSCDDQGLEAIAECRNLKGLSIRESPVTAKGFQKLRELKKLEELNLSSLKLTTEQLEILKSMTHLKSLTLVQCTLPPGSAEVFKSALPKVRVNIH